MKIFNTTLNKLRCYKFYCRADIFKYLYFPSTITDTSHILSAITQTKYLTTQCAKAFKPHDIGIYLFSITPSFPMSN